MLCNKLKNILALFHIFLLACWHISSTVDAIYFESLNLSTSLHSFLHNLSRPFINPSANPSYECCASVIVSAKS
ncbi:hypothetical protein BKA69DRAFT_1048160 [Paraphysoderma sedebokerense]|nr:hypothetical protein BKA69DRAFT_1048160 [Paraphysoderma sedebokerense]